MTDALRSIHEIVDSTAMPRRISLRLTAEDDFFMFTSAYPTLTATQVSGLNEFCPAGHELNQSSALRAVPATCMELTHGDARRYGASGKNRRRQLRLRRHLPSGLVRVV